MQCWLEIDGSALLHNYDLFRSLCPGLVAPVVKSNAYGHGLTQTYQALAPSKPEWLCVNYLEEADQLRRLGYPGRILIVGPCDPSQIADAAMLKVDITLGNAHDLQRWLSSTQRPSAHLKFDTGMGRQGFSYTDAPVVCQQIKESGCTEAIAGVSTHFANVEDVTEQDYANLQLQRFAAAVKPFTDEGIPVIRHAASSASSLILPASFFDMQRVGISLYGLWPSKATRISFSQQHGSVAELRPVLSWRTRVRTIKDVAKGEFIGYGCTFRTSSAMKIGVLPVGYFEGYPRLAGEQSSYVIVREQRCPIVGRICMNMMMIDLSHVEGAEINDIATLIGKDGAEELTADTVASWAHTIHYELVACINPAIDRKLVGTRY